MSWRRVALAACWIAAAGWGIFYFAVGAGQSTSYAGVAIVHFVIGYALASAVMAKQLTAINALLAIAAAGAFTRIAIVFIFPEIVFAPLGPIAAFAAADWSDRRSSAYSIVAFVVGFVAVIWLTP